MKLSDQLEQIREKLDVLNAARDHLMRAEAEAERLQISHAKLLGLVEELLPCLDRLSNAGNKGALDLVIRMRAAIALVDGWKLRDEPSPDGSAAQAPKPSAASTPLN